MKTIKWEIRLCKNTDCGLRYPVEAGHPNGVRCPNCLGETNLVLSYSAFEKPERQINTIGLIPVSGLLDNIRSAWNVGSIFRTSEGLGASHLYLTGITSTPDTSEIGKTALGAEKSVAWSYHRNSVTLSKELIHNGYILWALESRPKAKSAALVENYLDSVINSKGLVLVVGNEKAGVDPGLLELCHETFFIPMYGKKKSFNVSVAYGMTIGLIRINGH
jgi:23S rRNA (guanosine2251-2'-O)-methyltransferase